ncbi:hypothetical protein LZF95_09740 [Algoriphagus sp. AGSA1]|uniref:hypothetical protein n=1 Tax=Algoriphagus sp. AGSA1 TaxID=2907213 RepID=UPI001F471183|nr:hypothetical protein [Algoriphagus sp. AGSA1]MCE7054954.1 hypothetical protein [Algoriphagus sp. AGSA1]
MLELIPFQEISSIAIWIPLIFAGFRLKISDTKIRWFFVFLLIGAMVDGLGWVLFWNGSDFIIHAIFQYFYLFFEAIFFIWLACSFFKHKKVILFRNTLWVVVLIIFLIRASVVYLTDFNPAIVVAIADTFIMVCCSFLTAFALLRMAEEREDLMSYSWFWIVSGIFFYCFGTFFVDMLIFSSIAQAVWPLRNVVNILQYGFFVVGLVKMGSR